MDNQIFLIILIGLGFFAIILFSLDIYHLSKKPKEEKNAMSLKFSENFFSSLEKMINEEVKKTISETNKKINEKIAESYQKQITIFSQEAENKIAGWNEITKKEILKFNEIYSQAENSISKEAEKILSGLSKNLNERIDQVYQAATKSISQKISQTEKNIENYKEEKIKEIDEKIYQIIDDVAKKAIGKAIDLSVHEELINEALKKAKREIF